MSDQQDRVAFGPLERRPDPKAAFRVDDDDSRRVVRAIDRIGELLVAGGATGAEDAAVEVTLTVRSGRRLTSRRLSLRIPEPSRESPRPE